MVKFWGQEDTRRRQHRTELRRRRVVCDSDSVCSTHWEYQGFCKVM